MKENRLADLSMEFSIEIINLVKKLKSNHESIISNQIGRSGTSIGANIHEAQYAQGTKDFISKFKIALKECNECEYWLELFRDTNTVSEEEFDFFHKECISLRRMLVSSITTTINNTTDKV